MGWLEPDKKYCKWCAYAVQHNYFPHTPCKQLHECECKKHRSGPMTDYRYPTIDPDLIYN